MSNGQERVSPRIDRLVGIEPPPVPETITACRNVGQEAAGWLPEEALEVGWRRPCSSGCRQPAIELFGMLEEKPIISVCDLAAELSE